MRDYDVYIFDLYGTLVDIHTDESNDHFWLKVRDLFEGYGAVYKREELKDAYFFKIRQAEKKKAKKGHLIEIDLFEVFRSLFSDKDVYLTDEKIREAMIMFRKYSTSHIRLYAGAKEILDDLHRHDKKVFLLSNAQEVFTINELKELGIYACFDDIFISSVCGYKKPDRLFYEALLKKCGLDPKRCLMIGNDPICDVRGAKVLGIDTYYIQSSLSPKIPDEDPTYCQKGMDLKTIRIKISKGFDLNCRS
ncbi:MAG: HAD family hydrolase [Erysipelotrichaceae bacterium]|nr:HAD family hydrolase [Erysipelotrichaceae bacterium]